MTTDKIKAARRAALQCEDCGADLTTQGAVTHEFKQEGRLQRAPNGRVIMVLDEAAPEVRDLCAVCGCMAFDFDGYAEENTDDEA